MALNKIEPPARDAVDPSLVDRVAQAHAERCASASAVAVQVMRGLRLDGVPSGDVPKEFARRVGEIYSASSHFSVPAGSGSDLMYALAQAQADGVPLDAVIADSVGLPGVPVGSGSWGEASLAVAMSAPLSALVRHPYFGPPDGRHTGEIAVAVRDRLLWALEELLPPVSDESVLASASMSIASSVGGLMASIIEARAVAAAEFLSQKTDEQVAAWRRSSPDGFPVDKVIVAFGESVVRMVRLARSASRP